MASGYVVTSNDALVELAFPSEALPLTYGRLTAGSQSLVVLRVLPNGTVFAVASSGTTLWTPGQSVENTGEPFLDVLPDWVAANLVGPPTGATAPLATGLKSIDLFAPILENGRVGVFAEWGAGLLVVVPELLKRLDAPLKILAFTPPMRDEKQWKEVNSEVAEASGPVEVWYLPVASPTPQEFTNRILNLDAKLILSRPLAKQGIYPQIDPFRSYGFETTPLIRSVRELFRGSFDGEFVPTSVDPVEANRALSALKFLSQPLYVAEPYLGTPGVWVKREEAESTLEKILNGDYDALSSAAFFMQGSSAAPAS